MKISIKLLSNALLATTVFAGRSCQSMKKISHSEDVDGVRANDTLTENWAGAILAAPPDTAFYAIVGSFVAPYPSPPIHTGVEGEWAGSAWVGIDGYPDTTLFQAGISWTVYADMNGNLSHSYQAWYEWLPNYQSNFDNFEINAGDRLTVLSEAHSTSLGFCEIQNDSTGLRVSIDMTAPNNASLLIGKTAEWIVEDFSSLGGTVPFANFSKFKWTNCKADTGPSGFTDGKTTSLRPNDSTTIVDIAQNSVILTSTEVSGDNVTITYIG
jgi:Peptidase A4 family